MKRSELKRNTGLRTPRKRKCKACGERFQPFNSMQQACSPRCALDHGREERKRAEKRETRRLREKLKTRGQHLKEAQQAFNQWIRLRDADKPCISCGRHHQGQWHAGHYRTTAAAPELRFEPLNVHKQCAPCNNHKSGDIINYRINLVARIGQAAVDWLEGPHEPKKWTVDELKEIKRVYRAEARQIERQKG